MILFRGRRGQIPILMLFVVTIILVIVALMSFATFDRQFSDNPLNTSRTIAKVQFGEGYVLESAKSMATKVIEENKGVNLPAAFTGAALGFDRQVSDPANNLFRQIRDGKFSFEKIGEEYRLNVAGLFVQASYGANQITRKFDLCLLFDVDGDYIPKGFNETIDKGYAEKCGQKGSGI